MIPRKRCQRTFLAVAVIALTLSLIAVAPVSAATYYTGESENGYWDCCNIELTRVHTYFNYWDDGSSVWGAYNAGYSCGHFNDGWTLDSYTGAYSGTGPDPVYVQGQCWFHYAPNNGWYHWQLSEYDGHPGWWYHWCDQSGATVPRGGWSCDGWRT